MNIEQFPRNRYTSIYTPIEKANRFSAALKGPNVYIKRDDLLGLTEGGNKTRKLEFLIADAQAKGANTIITAGGIQSNHCRLTLAACVRENLKCILVLEENKDDSYDLKTNGNYLLYQLLGTEAIKIVPNGTDVYEVMEKVSKEVREKGDSPYVIPVGGSNVTGVTGYVACAKEIHQQSMELGIQFDYVICASGSGGMHAGLVTGFAALQSETKVIGINVSRGKSEQEFKVHQLSMETGAHVGLKNKIPMEKVKCFDEFVGPAYAVPTKGMIDAVKLLARTEAIILDPVYTGKTMDGLITLIQQGYFKPNDNILFVHSGGTPAVYAYSTIFNEQS